MYLDYPQLKIALYEAIKPLFADCPPILQTWKKQANSLTEEEKTYHRPHGDSSSFYVLWYLFAECLYYQVPLTKDMIETTMRQHHEIIRTILIPFIKREFPQEEIKFSKNKHQVDEALGKDYIWTSMDTDWHLIREMVAKNPFQEQKGITELVDGRGMVKGLAEIRTPEPIDIQSEHQPLWDDLVSEALLSLDDVTADLLDVVAYLWMVSPRTPDGYLEFHSDDALKIRNIKPRSVRGKEVGFREEDRFAIMKRIVTLSSIWVSLGDGSIRVVDTPESKTHEQYQFRNFQKMFEISGIQMAYQKSTGEPVGVYAVKIKPTTLISQYLEGAKRSLGVLDLRAFQYNPRTQKAHKRLTRYLGWQFKIRSIRRNYSQPFKVSTLLRVLELRESLSGEELRTRFEETLDDLQQDKVIQEWRYVEGFDEHRVGERGWIKNYFTTKHVIILPPREVMELNSHTMSLPTGTRYTVNMLEEIMNMSFQNKRLVEEESRLGEASEYALAIRKESKRNLKKNTDLVTTSVQLAKQPLEKRRGKEGVVLTPTTIKQEREKRGLSIRQASKKIGLTHTTLSRYEKGEIKNLHLKHQQKMMKWLQE